MSDLSVITLALCRKQNTRRLPHTPLLVSDRFLSIWLMRMLGNKSATLYFNTKIYLINSMATPFFP